jgi:hypothetical protein
MRGQQMPSADIVCDLDALISKPVGFTFQGKTHVIKPISTLVLFKAIDGIGGLQGLSSGQYSQEELINAYVKIFSSVCDTIGKREVEAMTDSQKLALFQIILDCIKGKAHAPAHSENGEEEKKKT